MSLFECTTSPVYNTKVVHINTLTSFSPYMPLSSRPTLFLFLFLLHTSLLCSAYQKPSTIILENVAYSYYLHTNVDVHIADAALNTSAAYSILVDTGSSFLVLKTPTDAVAFDGLKDNSQLSISECLYLIVDDTRANFTGTPDKPMECRSSVADEAANVQLLSSSGGNVAVEAEVAFKLAFRFMAGNCRSQ